MKSMVISLKNDDLDSTNCDLEFLKSLRKEYLFKYTKLTKIKKLEFNKKYRHE